MPRGSRSSPSSRAAAAVFQDLLQVETQIASRERGAAVTALGASGFTAQFSVHRGSAGAADGFDVVLGTEISTTNIR